jgi:hypothetical protein
MRQGYDYPIWADAMVEKLVEEFERPGTTIGEEEFLGRPCKVYSYTMVYPNSKGTDTQEWWVWNGVTLRSQLHTEIEGTITETFEEAVHIEVDVDIDASLFTPPNDVTFEPVEQTPAERLDHRKSPPWVRVGPNLARF